MRLDAAARDVCLERRDRQAEQRGGLQLPAPVAAARAGIELLHAGEAVPDARAAPLRSPRAAVDYRGLGRGRRHTPCHPAPRFASVTGDAGPREPRDAAVAPSVRLPVAAPNSVLSRDTPVSVGFSGPTDGRASPRVSGSRVRRRGRARRREQLRRGSRARTRRRSASRVRGAHRCCRHARSELYAGAVTSRG